MTRWITFALLAALALLASSACSSSGDEEAGPSPIVYLGDSIAGEWEKPDFTLTDTFGKPYSLRAETEGYVTAIYFGYTNCPDICPTHMADLAAALDEHPEFNDKVKVVFVTADPPRDTAERLRLWLDLFNEDFVGLFGTPELIVNAAQLVFRDLYRPFTTYPTHVNDPTHDDYTVSHPAFVLAYGTDNKAHVIWQLGTTVHQYANDLALLVNEGAAEEGEDS